MVENAPGYRLTFKSMSTINYLGNMAPFVNTDITNPRELYALLSDARNQGAVPNVHSQGGAKLPPLKASSKVQVRSVGGPSQSMHHSYPDLLSFRNRPGAQSCLAAARRSTSLQDISKLQHDDAVSKSKKLRPILRASETKAASEQQDKSSVTFGQKRVHMIKDPPLPPIDVPSPGKDALSLTTGSRDKGEADPTPDLGLSPRNPRRSALEHSPDIFPRGQAGDGKKPKRPKKYDDYPEIYWELRSPTVQNPSDLKEDMIDRDRYRLQQISSLRLRAMNREVAVNRLDSYRKWQQQTRDNSPQQLSSAKQDSARSSATHVSNGQVTSAKAGKQQRMSMPIPSHSLAVAAQSINPAANKATTKTMENNRIAEIERVAQANHLSTSSTTGKDSHRQQKLDAASKDDKSSEEGKAVKAAVVNLCIEPDRSNLSPNSDVYLGIRRVMVAPPQSDRPRTYVSSQDQHHNHAKASTHGPGSECGASVNATLGSSYSHRYTRAGSAPTDYPSDMGSMTDRDANGSPSSRKLLRKFTKLQVFSEKMPAQENSQEEEQEAVFIQSRSTPRSPQPSQSRSPLYKLDMRNYPPRRYDPSPGEYTGVISDNGLPLPDSVRISMPMIPRSPDRSEATALSFRFSNGEVIVSRQGKKPDVT